MATSAPPPPASLPRRPRGTAAQSPGDVVECDVRDVNPDAVTVEALARLQVIARRHGCTLRLRNASAELMDVIELMGLGSVLTKAR